MKDEAGGAIGAVGLIVTLSHSRLRISVASPPTTLSGGLTGGHYATCQNKMSATKALVSSDLESALHNLYHFHVPRGALLCSTP